jgi:Family of unknown function (DUF5755)
MRKRIKGGSLNSSSNLFLMLIFVIMLLIGLLVYTLYQTLIVNVMHQSVSNLAYPSMEDNNPNIFTNPFRPPLKTDQLQLPLTASIPVLPPTTADIRGSPSYPVFNYPTRGFNGPFSQIGILTRENDSKGDNLILPLMGRRITNANDKLQYYTISNTGSVNSKLPIRKRGRSCTGEYGCDELYNGDVVHVEGYNEPFRATVYENATFAYIPI